jgi:hypothetical protein
VPSVESSGGGFAKVEDDADLRGKVVSYVEVVEERSADHSQTAAIGAESDGAR